MRGDGSIVGEGRVVGVPKFHSWGKCTMALTNINSDWVSNAYSGLCIIYAGPFIRILGCKYIILYYTILYYIILYYIILYYITLHYITFD